MPTSKVAEKPAAPSRRAASAPARAANAKREPLVIATLAAPPRTTYGEVAYANLREAILTTRLLPGTPISENDLSAAIGVSRTPIREAIRRLVEDRLVEVTPHLGTIVSRIDTRRVQQAVFVRRVVECEVLEKKGVLSEAALDGLERQVRSHIAAIESQEPIASALLDDDFHGQLMAACDCPEATVATRAISGDITRTLFLSGADEHYFASVAADHLELVNRMRRGDYEAALDLLGRHLGGFVVDQEKLKEHSSDFFVSE